MGRRRAAQRIDPAPPLRIDLGCGGRCTDGFVGVDRLAFPGVSVQLEIGQQPWPWETDSVDGARASHVVEHLTARERVHFCNELYRVLKPGASCELIVPHWASCRAYGDPTHQWPPVSEFWFYYLSREWREANAPHTDIAHSPEGFNCHFAATWGYAMRQDLSVRSNDFQQFAIANYKEAVQDMVATLTKA